VGQNILGDDDARDGMTEGPTFVEQNLFRDVIGRFASGVTVITTRAGGADFGTTASAVSSLSMEPPMLLICMNATSETGRAILSSGRFVVNILGAGQVDLAKRFATKLASKFDGVEIERAEDGLPRLASALGHLGCRVAETAKGGTHTIFISHVEHATATEGSPLTYYRGRFGGFEDEEQEVAYRAVRRLVLSRARAAGEPLRLDDLAAEFGFERPRVQYALMKLVTDGLVSRDPGRGFSVRPMDAGTVGQAIDARKAIEVAVADEVIGHVDPDDIGELRTHATAALRAAQSDPPDYAALRLAGRQFHDKFIGLAGNEALLAIYGRLAIDAIWVRLLSGRYLDPGYLLIICDAVAAGDTDLAKKAIREHAAEAIAVVGVVIAEAGGEI
jgi:flavin reductase (DIM6/NTAB) family NADH-FMN oxidoreductase RutF/DNA-binding GntR family transcriptional regulator